MATVDKNFRIKNGLVVEGSTATVGGNDVLTKKQDDQDYIINLIGGTATSANTANAVVKRDNNGDFSAGTITADLVGNVTGTVSSLSNHDTDDLTEGSSNLYFTDARAKSSAADLLTNANLTNITITGNGSGLTITAENGVADSTTDDLVEGSNNKYFTNQRALDATSAAYDAAGAASDALADANSYTDTAIGSLDTNQVPELPGIATNLYFTNQRALDATAAAYDAAGAASNAETAANSYTNNAIDALNTDDIEEGSSNKYYTDSRARASLSSGTGISYNSSTGQISVDNTIATQTYVNDAIDNLVDGAPGILDTLNEIAAAIGDDANYFTTIAGQIAAKQDTLTAGSNIDITGSTISVTGLDTDDVAEGSNLYFTDQRAIDALDGTTPSFNGVNFGWVSKDFSNYQWISNGSQTTVATWPLNYATAKLLVHMRNGSHSQASEIMIARDSSNNIAISEYGIVTTNGSLGDITASVSGSDIILQVTPTHSNGTDVAVRGSAVIWAD